MLNNQNFGIIGSKFSKMIVLVVFCFLGALSPLNATEEGDIKRGQDMVDKLCASCHSVGETGLSPFKDAPPFRDIVGRWPVESLAEALGEGIVVGHPAMPEFQFEPDELNDLLAYLSTLSDAKPKSE